MASTERLPPSPVVALEVVEDLANICSSGGAADAVARQEKHASRREEASSGKEWQHQRSAEHRSGSSSE
jgi:hypothetical protein